MEEKNCTNALPLTCACTKNIQIIQENGREAPIFSRLAAQALAALPGKILQDGLLRCFLGGGIQC